jgi:hypothetical protein
MSRALPLVALAAALLLAGSAGAVPERREKIVPASDVTPMQPFGAAARARNGPEPLATPPADAGMTPDPDEQPAPGVVQPPAPGRR